MEHNTTINAMDPIRFPLPRNEAQGCALGTAMETLPKNAEGFAVIVFMIQPWSTCRCIVLLMSDVTQSVRHKLLL